MEDIASLIELNKKQDEIIWQLMEDIKRLQIRCSDLERAKLTVDKVIKRNELEGYSQVMMITNVFPGENGVIIEISG